MGKFMGRTLIQNLIPSTLHSDENFLLNKTRSTTLFTLETRSRPTQVDVQDRQLAQR